MANLSIVVANHNRKKEFIVASLGYDSSHTMYRDTQAMIKYTGM